MSKKIQRGGAFLALEEYLSGRYRLHPEERYFSTGFRVVQEDGRLLPDGLPRSLLSGGSWQRRESFLPVDVFQRDYSFMRWNSVGFRVVREEGD